MAQELMVSNGEIVDRLTIAQIRSSFTKKDDAKHEILMTEIGTLVEKLELMYTSCLNNSIYQYCELEYLVKQLYLCNRELWNIEDEIRMAIRHVNMISYPNENDNSYQDLDDLSQKLLQTYKYSYLITRLNKQRSELKQTINVLTDSNIKELKNYATEGK